MSFTRQHRSLSGCACSGGRGVGDVASVITGGSSASSDDPLTVLRAQLNRFADQGAGALQLFTSPLPQGVPIGLADTSRVGAVLLARTAQPAFANVSSATQAQVGTMAGDAMADTSGAYVSANILPLTAIVSGFADAAGLPAAVLPGQLLAGVDNTTLLVGGVALLAAYLLLRKKRVR